MKQKVELSNGQIVKLNKKELEVLHTTYKNLKRRAGHLYCRIDFFQIKTISNLALNTFMKVAIENNAEKKKELIDNLFKKFEADRITVDSYSKDHYYCEFQDEETGQMHHVESYDNLISDYNNLKSRGLLTHNDAVDFEVYDLQPIENQRSYIEDLLHNIGKTAAHFYKEGELKEEGGIEKPEKTKPEKTK